MSTIGTGAAWLTRARSSLASLVVLALAACASAPADPKVAQAAETEELQGLIADAREAGLSDAIMLVVLGDAAAQAGQYDTALETYERAHVLAVELVKSDPDGLDAQRDLAHVLDRLGNIAQLQDRPGDAYGHWTEVAVIAEELLAAEPDSPGWTMLMAQTRYKLFTLGAIDAYTQAFEAQRLLTLLQETTTLDETGLEMLASVTAFTQASQSVDDSVLDSETPFRAGDYQAAYEASTQLLMRVHTLYSSGALSPSETAGRFGSHAWHALFIREFGTAESSARTGLDVDPSQAWISMNLAHALMFQDRLEEADALYQAHSGELIPQVGDRPWDDIVAEDFAALRAAGIDHPHMDDVLEMLAD